jgi:hypothetical protein
MTLFDHQYSLHPDPSAGKHGVYSAHVKYVTDAKSPAAIDFWVSRAWLGDPHPPTLVLFFRSVDIKPPAGWDLLRLRMRLSGETRREYASVEQDRSNAKAVTGVYVDSHALTDPPPKHLCLWMLGRKSS